MKKLIGYLLALLYVGILYFPMVGYLYLLAMLVAGGFMVFAASPSALAVATLAWGWKVYMLCAALTLFVMETFHYQNCCVGFNSFSRHLRNCGLRRHLDQFLVALLWPHGWNMVVANMAGWGMSWMDIVFNAFEYWLYSRWRGVRIETWVRGQEGMEVTRANDPGEVSRILRGVVSQVSKPE